MFFIAQSIAPVGRQPEGKKIIIARIRKVIYDDPVTSEVKDDAVVTLFRPVGLKELELIAESGYTEFPPRLPEQPIFYPVLNEEYARQIARDWNTKYSESKRGYVTQFHVRADYIQRYEVMTVGGSEHQEYWIPAEELGEFNRNIIGQIEVIAEFQPSQN
jgi:hypothetical protein